MSEENLEALHKIARKIRESKARLRNMNDNMTDIITRLNVRSDPVVQYYEPKVLCKICGHEGHSQIGCEYAEGKVDDNMSLEDILFWSHVHPCDRPVCCQ